MNLVKTKIIIKEISLYLIVIFNPKYWISNYIPDPVLDKKIRDIIYNEKPITKLSRYECCFGSLSLWIGNYPYAYGEDTSFEKLKIRYETLPTRRTRILLRRYIKEQTMYYLFDRYL